MVTQLNVQTLAAIVGLILPVGVALLVKRYGHPALKVALNLFLSAAAAVIALFTQNNAGHPITFWLCVNTGLAALLTSLTSYVTIWKPILNINDKMAPQFGLGNGNGNAPVVNIPLSPSPVPEATTTDQVTVKPAPPVPPVEPRPVAPDPKVPVKATPRKRAPRHVAPKTPPKTTDKTPDKTDG